MQRVTGEYRDSLIAGFQREALHLEMRDAYAAADHSRFRRWLAGEAFDLEARGQWWRPWREMMGRHQAAGKALRRLRVVSEPVTEYIKFEWLDAAELVRLGEDVRWLPPPAGVCSTCYPAMTCGASTPRRSCSPTSPETARSRATS